MIDTGDILLFVEVTALLFFYTLYYFAFFGMFLNAEKKAGKSSLLFNLRWFIGTFLMSSVLVSIGGSLPVLVYLDHSPDMVSTSLALFRKGIIIALACSISITVFKVFIYGKEIFRKRKFQATLEDIKSAKDTFEWFILEGKNSGNVTINKADIAFLESLKTKLNQIDSDFLS
jgi:hypothetical protein